MKQFDFIGGLATSSSAVDCGGENKATELIHITYYSYYQRRFIILELLWLIVLEIGNISCNGKISAMEYWYRYCRVYIIWDTSKSCMIFVMYTGNADI